VAQSHLINFLTPRDCPRMARLNACRLHIYQMPGETFEEALPEAGYWISR